VSFNGKEQKIKLRLEFRL